MSYPRAKIVAKSTNQWLNCGRCKFIGKTDGARVTYGGNDKTGGSESYLKEPLTVLATAWNAEGQSASATCTTNFTVVKVDVVLDQWGEDVEESEPRNFCMSMRSMSMDREQMPMEFRVICTPRNLPSGEYIRYSKSSTKKIGKLEIIGPGQDMIVDVADYPFCFPVSGCFANSVSSHKYEVLAAGPSRWLNDNDFTAVHENSGAKDMIRYTDIECAYTACVDLPGDSVKEGIGEAWKWSAADMGPDTGHAWCEVSVKPIFIAEEFFKEDAKYANTPVGICPAGSGLISLLEFGDEKAEFKMPDNDHPSEVESKWQISMGQAESGIAAIKTVKVGVDAGTYFYNTRKNNCVDFVLQIGRACMVDIRYSEEWNTPGGLAKWIIENVSTDSTSGN